MPIQVFTIPIWVFTMLRCCCSRSSDLGVHDAPKHALNLLVRWFERIKVITKILPETDRAMFLCRYGLDDECYELRPFPIVAKLVGVKPDRVRQRIEAIIRRIRAVGVGSPLSEERLEFEIQRAHAIQAALADRSPFPRVE